VTPTRSAIFAPQTTFASSTIVLPTQVPPPAATLPPRATAAPACTDGASFIEDLTVPDGTEVLPGEAIDKRWSVSNTGTCHWGPDYRLVQVGSSGIVGPLESALFPARAGATAIWEVALVAPSEPGEYLARWQARAPDGTLFGDEVFVLILVAEPEPTASPTVSPTP
jgi:hypothetical protein